MEIRLPTSLSRSRADSFSGPCVSTAIGWMQTHSSDLCTWPFSVSLQFIYATADEADAYICLTDVFFVFLPFPFATKIPDNRSRERLNGFSWNFYQMINDSGENGVCIAVPKWGLGPPINFCFGGRGLKTTIAHLVVTPGEWLGISLLAMALCSYGGCVQKAWARECI